MNLIGRWGANLLCAGLNFKKFGLPYYCFILHNIPLVSFFVFISCALSFYVHINVEKRLFVSLFDFVFAISI